MDRQSPIQRVPCTNIFPDLSLSVKDKPYRGDCVTPSSGIYYCIPVSNQLVVGIKHVCVCAFVSLEYIRDPN